MAFSYEPEKVPTEALHWVRYKVGATKNDASPLVDDEEIHGALVLEGLTLTSVPSEATRKPLHFAAASVARSIAAAFARQGSAGAPPGQSPKHGSAEIYLKLALQLEAQGSLLVSISEVMVDTSIVPFELVDNVDYRRDRFGEDHSEYVGDEVS